MKEQHPACPPAHIWLILGWLLLAVSPGSGQSGWTQPAKGLFAKVDWSYLNAAEFATPDAELVEAEQFLQHNINLYAEYGITDRLTVLLQGPLLRTHRFITTESATGIGDLRLDLKYRLTSDYLPVAVSLGAEIPSGNPNLTAPEKMPPNLERPLPTGDGEWNFWGTVAASRGWQKTYLSAFGAINIRTENDLYTFSNLYQAGVEFGFRPVDPIWLSLKVRAQFRDAPTETPPSFFLYGDGTTYTLTALEAYLALIGDWGATITFLSGGDLLSKARNLYLAPMISLGIVYSRQNTAPLPE